MKKLLPLLLLFASGLYGQFTPPPVLATQAEAEAGTNNTKFMSPLRTAQAIAAQGGGGGAPTTATYITQTPNGGLSAEQALSLLGSGLVYNTTTTGVLSIVSSSTVGAVLRVTGANTFAFGAVDLADSDAITGTLPIANGGTASTTASAAVDALGGAAATGTGGLARKTGAALVTPDIGAATGTSLVLSGAATAASFTASGSDAGRLNLPEGPATALIANTFSIWAPTDVPAGGLGWVGPSTAGSGIIRVANAAGVGTLSQSELSGDIVTSGSNVTVLATVNSNVGTFGSATAASVVTLNAKGLVTAGSNVTITPAAASVQVGALADGMTATTQSPATNTTRIASGAYADASSAAAALAGMVSTYATPDTTGGAVTLTKAVTEVWTNTTTTYTIPAVASSTGKAIIFYVVGTNLITIDPNASEIIVRAGTAQTGGVTMTLAGVAGNYVCLICDGTRWVTLGYSGVLAAGS